MKETSSLDEDDCANIVCDKDVLCIVVDAIVTVHLDQYYQCSSHLAPPPSRTARDPNMTAQCSPPPSQHLQYLLTLDMQLISLLYH